MNVQKAVLLTFYALFLYAWTGFTGITQAGQMGWTLKKLRAYYGRELGRCADGSCAQFKQGTFFFDPDGTVGTINIWKGTTNRYCEPFSDEEINRYLHAAAEVTWTQTANTLKGKEGFAWTALDGGLEYVALRSTPCAKPDCSGR